MSAQNVYGRPSRRPPSRTTNIVAAVVLAVAVVCIAGVAIAFSRNSDDTPSAPEITTVEGDPARLDAAAKLACEDYLSGYAAAQTRQARVDLANKVNKWSSKSVTNGIAEGGKALGRSAEAADQVWALAGDTFASACIAAGWPTKAP